MTNLTICKYFVTNKHGELLTKTDFRKSEEKTDLLTEEVGGLWGSQLGSIQRGLFSASVGFSDIKTLPILAMRQFLPFNKVDSMKKTQSDIVDPDNIIIDVI